MSREGEGEEGVCMHERKLVVATKVRGLCGCKTNKDHNLI